MENNPNTPDPIEVAGSLSDPMTQSRLQAVAKAKDPKGIKARHLVKTTETVKVASAFGVVSKEVEVEKTVEKTLVGKQEAVTTETPSEDAQDAEIRARLVANGTPPEEIDAKIAEARKIRDALKGEWSQDIKKTSSADDKFIEGLPADNNGVTVNPDAGANGVRMKFTSKPRE